MNGSSSEFNKLFSARFTIPALLILLYTIGASAIGLHQARLAVDHLSAEGQVYEAYRGLGKSLDDLSLAQETLGSCDYCVKTVSSAQPDMSWLDDNIGFRLFDIYKADETYILNGSDQPVYAARGRNRAPVEAIDQRLPILRPFIDRVRSRVQSKNNYNERLPHAALPLHSAVRTTREAVHSSDFAMIDGKPALISVMRMIARTPALNAAPDRTPLIINIRYMGDSFLAEMGRQNFLAAARIAPEKKLGRGEYAVTLASSRGQKLGYFIWKPLLSGSMLTKSLLPLVVSTIAVLTGLLAALGLYIRHLMRRDHNRTKQLETAHVELKASEAQAHHLAYHDALTGLPNRARFNSSADVALLRAGQDRHVAMLLLDLDRFKSVNDRFGHLAGDQLIEEVAQRLAGILQNGDCTARLGGDEFAILLTDVRDAADVEVVLQQILHEMRQPFDVLGNKAYIGVSIGVAMAPDCGTDRSDLMRKADIALYRAKDEGRDCYRFFNDAMDDTVQLRATLESDLREALTSGQNLSVHYQPQMDAFGKTVVGLEALVRWEHPLRGLISPDVFVPIAEETGLITALGDHVLHDACRVAHIWPNLSIAVNLSPVQFRTEGFANHVDQLIRKAGVSPRQMELEVTEGVLLDDDEMVRKSLRELREKGFRIALDDFGTGYSSLSYLRKFDVDKIKIDKSFVRHLSETDDAAAIITAVVTLGHAMGLQVTAEGVETTEQSAFLAAAGCNELQGFLYSRAVPIIDLDALLKNRTRQRAYGKGQKRVPAQTPPKQDKAA